MQKVQLLFENSPWWIVVCLAVGAVYAGALYLRRKSEAWSEKVNYTLLALRFMLVSLLCFLVIGPFIKQIKNTVEEPVVVLAVDNSASVAAVLDSTEQQSFQQRLDSILLALNEADYQVEIYDLAKPTASDSLAFDAVHTDLDKLLRNVAADYEGRNLASVALFSDGIYNQGVSPTYRPYRFSINTVGVGDTIPKQDVNINNLAYNKIAYQGNQFPLVVEVLNTGFAGEELSVSVSQRGRTLATQQVTPQNRRDISTVEFLLEADQEGTQHYVVTVSEQEGEFTYQNNEAHAYVEVVEGKENILLLAQSPHPDIKALRAAVESNKNYELNTVVLSTDDLDQPALSNKKFDLVIMHQLPGRSPLPTKLAAYQQAARAVWYIVGSQTDLSKLDQTSNLLTLGSVGNQTDEVGAVYNDAFSGFQLTNDERATIEEFVPLRVPFGEVELQNEAAALLNRRVGNIETSQPLLVVGEYEEQKSAVLLGSGIWKWRQQEYARSEKTTAFDALFTKLVQYLSAKEDKRRFRVYPTKNEFEDTEAVVFETEIYDEVYEEVYGESVTLNIVAEDSTVRDYSYVTNQNNTQYRISNLPEGVYRYTASMDAAGARASVEGEFTVRSSQVETLNLTADHNLLRTVATNNGGDFFEVRQTQALVDKLSTQQATGKIYTSELFLPLVNLKWLFFVLLLLVSVEWGIRKYMGSY